MTIPSFGDLRGKSCLVTGGSSGIGAAVARALGACGAKVAVHYHEGTERAAALAAEVRAAGGTAMTVQADLSTAAPPTDAMVAAVVREFGGLDVLVNNAGEPVARAPITEMPDALFDAIMNLNYRSVFAACRSAIPALKRRRGCIINTSSVAGRTGGIPGALIYAAAKAAVNSLTRGLAKELIPDGIRVNAVSPGIIDTPLHKRLTPPPLWEKFVSAVPMGRAGAADDCVGAYLYLASGALSGYVTGQIIEVNGGQLMPP